MQHRQQGNNECDMSEDIAIYQRMEQLFRDFYNHGRPKHHNTASKTQNTPISMANVAIKGGKHGNND